MDNLALALFTLHGQASHCNDLQMTNDACVFGYNVTLPSSTHTLLTGHLPTLESV